MCVETKTFIQIFTDSQHVKHTISKVSFQYGGRAIHLLWSDYLTLEINRLKVKHEVKTSRLPLFQIIQESRRGNLSYESKQNKHGFSSIWEEINDTH